MRYRHQYGITFYEHLAHTTERTAEFLFFSFLFSTDDPVGRTRKSTRSSLRGRSVTRGVIRARWPACTHSVIAKMSRPLIRIATWVLRLNTPPEESECLLAEVVPLIVILKETDRSPLQLHHGPGALLEQASANFQILSQQKTQVSEHTS